MQLFEKERKTLNFLKTRRFGNKRQKNFNLKLA